MSENDTETHMRAGNAGYPTHDLTASYKNGVA